MATTDSPQELSFMFGRIEDATLVPHPQYLPIRYGGPPGAWDFFTKPIRDVVDGDWAYLIPPAPIPYSPYHFLWARVAQMCRDRSLDDWPVWEGGAYPLDVHPAEQGTFVYVIAVPFADFFSLSEGRDYLTELRINAISARPSESPSKGGQPAVFAEEQARRPLSIGRPKSDVCYPLPISLLHPAFARFKEDIVLGPVEPELSPLAYKWCRKLSDFFDKETSRETLFHSLLSELLDGYRISKKRFSGYTTDGGIDSDLFIELFVKPLLIEVKGETTCGISDAVFESALYHFEGIRRILLDQHRNGAWRKSRIPSIIIIHNGPNIQVLGAVCLDEPLIEVLSPSLPLYFNEYDTPAMENLIRFMGALRRLFRSLLEIYEKSTVDPIGRGQVNFPYPSSYQPLYSAPESGVVTSTGADNLSGTITTRSEGSIISIGSDVDSITESVAKINIEAGTSASSRPTFESIRDIQFTYISRIDPIRLVFRARTATENIIVKFGYGHYGLEAHQAVAKAGLGPALLGYSKLEGGWWMVVMELLDSGFEPCAKIKVLETGCRAVVEETMARFSALGFVHGDLRASNVLVRKLDGRWECKFIDFDWAGRPNQVRYPIGVYRTSNLFRPEAYMDEMLITAEHDQQTMLNMLTEHSSK
ncbi:hypothetical protein D9757_009837 [Collybiopsis confluens]|uniref:Uncharacterized protein n=1 Tax=Collybiopsis confluens TaxID=2823264 RepID=A0A8H5M1N1_9AGAR|nr:hypothetical protein D9757_009837 [Collybiopsis confluens]